jgi:hypothetical protein
MRISPAGWLQRGLLQSICYHVSITGAQLSQSEENRVQNAIEGFSISLKNLASASERCNSPVKSWQAINNCCEKSEVSSAIVRRMFCLLP